METSACVVTRKRHPTDPASSRTEAPTVPWSPARPFVGWSDRACRFRESTLAHSPTPHKHTPAWPWRHAGNLTPPRTHIAPRTVATEAPACYRPGRCVDFARVRAWTGQLRVLIRACGGTRSSYGSPLATKCELRMVVPLLSIVASPNKMAEGTRNDPMLDTDDNATGDVFDLLASSRRRRLLGSLIAHDDAAPLRQLSREIAAHETDSSPAAVDTEEIRRVYISLYQTHVPLLERHGIVAFDADEKVVSLEKRPDEVLTAAAGGPTPSGWWLLYCAVLAVALGALTVGLVLQLAPVSRTVVAAFTGLSAVSLVVIVSVRYAECSTTRYTETVLDALTQ